MRSKVKSSTMECYEKRKEGPLKCSPSLLSLLDLDSDRPRVKSSRNYIREITFVTASFLIIPVDRPGIISVLTNVCSTNTAFHKLISLYRSYSCSDSKSIIREAQWIQLYKIPVRSILPTINNNNGKKEIPHLTRHFIRRAKRL